VSSAKRRIEEELEMNSDHDEPIGPLAPDTEASNSGLGWIIDALYALIQLGKVIWPNSTLWDDLESAAEVHDPRPKP
jgi:hypothetical protein